MKKAVTRRFDLLVEAHEDYKNGTLKSISYYSAKHRCSTFSTDLLMEFVKREKITIQDAKECLERTNAITRTQDKRVCNKKKQVVDLSEYSVEDLLQHLKQLLEVMRNKGVKVDCEITTTI